MGLLKQDRKKKEIHLNLWDLGGSLQNNTILGCPIFGFVLALGPGDATSMHLFFCAPQIARSHTLL